MAFSPLPRRPNSLGKDSESPPTSLQVRSSSRYERWTSSARIEQLYQRFYINVDREAFDRWLVSLVPSCVEGMYGWSLTGLERNTGGSFLRFRTAQGGSAGVRAKLVIGADGAASLVRRLAFPGAPSPRRYVAIQATFELGLADPFYGAVFDETLTDFYGWTVPKRGDLLAGIALPSGAGSR